MKHSRVPEARKRARAWPFRLARSLLYTAYLAFHLVPHAGTAAEVRVEHNIAKHILEQNSDFEAATHLVDIPGLSSPRVCRFLNELVRQMDPGEAYLEVGTFKGRTLLSAAWNNRGKRCVGCDKFRLWGRFTGPGFLARRALLANVSKHRAYTADIEFYPITSRELLDRKLVTGPVGVYFYDGDHSYEGTHHGVCGAVRLLARRSVLVMDDYNDPIIRCATREAIAAAGLQVLWHRNLRGDHTETGFWNGLGVFFLEKPSTLFKTV